MFRFACEAWGVTVLPLSAPFKSAQFGCWVFFSGEHAAMAGKRRWLSAIVATAIGLAGAVIPVLAQAVAEAIDFQVLAVKPEKLGKSFRLIPVGESTLDPAAYDAVVESLPVSMFGGIKLPDYDEKAERTQCRAACIANKGCTTFIYVSRAKDRPLGLCRLRRAVEQQTITAVRCRSG
jgi:hypothetical protein